MTVKRTALLAVSRFSARSEVHLCLDVEMDLHFANLIQKWRRSGIGNFDFKMPDDEWATGDWEREDAATGGILKNLSDAKALVLLIGEYTRRQTPRVDLQLRAALQLDVPIIAVNLNDLRRQDHLCPRLIAKELALYIAFNPRILSFAIENWPRLTRCRRRAAKSDHSITATASTATSARSPKP